MSRPAPARDRLLDAALGVIRAKGFSATSVDDLCAAAGVTKGAFFHHFESKEALGVAAADHWSEVTGAFFAAAPYHAPADPLERVFGYLAFRREIIEGDLPEFTCLVGTMAQELHQTSPAITAACEASISAHSARVEADIAAAMRERGLDPEGTTRGWSAKGLSLHMQAVLQGAFILAKATGGPDIARESVDHLIRYVQLLFKLPEKEGASP
jgi:TetR/AcrR family transcriptional repressor of nem operon